MAEEDVETAEFATGVPGIVGWEDTAGAETVLLTNLAKEDAFVPLRQSGVTVTREFSVVVLVLPVCFDFLEALVLDFALDTERMRLLLPTSTKNSVE